MKKLLTALLILICNIAISQTGWYLQTTQTTKSLQDIFFINSQTGWACGDSGIIIKTTNSGINWVNKAAFTNLSLRSIRFSDANYGYVAGGRQTSDPFCIDEDILAKTTDGGETWIVLLSNDTWDVFYDLAIINKDTAFATFAGTDNSCMAASGGTYRTLNSGGNWNYSGGGWMNGISFINSTTGWVTSFSIGDILIGYFSVFKTTNTGVNWNVVYRDTSFGGSYIGKIRFVDENNGFCLYKMLRKTTNGGINWQKVDSVSTYGVISFAPINKDTIWIVHNLTNVKRTNNGGLNWTQQFTAAGLNSIYFLDENTGWIAGSNGFVYKTITGGLTGIQNVSFEIPSSYSLEQNYPNPFNSMTKIRFDVPYTFLSPHGLGGDLITLSVFDITGREVQKLVNERLSPGTYSVDWNASVFPSGVYFYRLHAGSFTETKRMLMIK